MAKYTEQFGEWLKNHSLPVIFDEIENLKDLFILKYIDCEIGYETEWLFEQKLILKANIVIPEYKDRIQALKTAELYPLQTVCLQVHSPFLLLLVGF